MNSCLTTCLMAVALFAFTGLSSSANAAQKTTLRAPAHELATTSTSTTTATSPALTFPRENPNVLAFNFVNMARGNANIYFDVGGLSELVSPSLSYRTSSRAEARKNFDDQILTVDRTIATLGASILAVRSGKISLLVSPYLFFGTEKDALETRTMNGIGGRILGQLQVNKTVAFQGGIDANNMSSSFRGDLYLGLGLSI
jgi:hypothetical protein